MPAHLPSGLSGSLREVVLAGPASPVVLADQGASGALAVVACPVRVAAALKKAGHVDARRRVLTGPVTTALVLGLCLFTGLGYPCRAGPVVAAAGRVQPRDLGVGHGLRTSVVAGQSPFAGRGPALTVRGPGWGGRGRGHRAARLRARRDGRGRHRRGPGGHRRDA